MALRTIWSGKKRPDSDPGSSPENPFGTYDVKDIENGAYVRRKGGRIDKPIRAGSIIPTGSEEDEGSISVGKQMEMEADNAIKYRTCSWPKVLSSSSCFIPAPRDYIR